MVKRLTNEIVDKRIEGSDVYRIGDYKGDKVFIEWKCKKCNHIWEAMPNNILRGRKCPKCTLKQKESRVATYLKELCSIDFEKFIPEYRILRNPKTNRFLPFDIYIEHGDLKFLIEIHGKQHYEIVGGYYNSIEEFNYRKEIDSFKKNWAIKNNYLFIEVPANFNKIQCEQIIEEIKNNKIKRSINYYEKQ